MIFFHKESSHSSLITPRYSTDLPFTSPPYNDTLPPMMLPRLITVIKMIPKLSSEHQSKTADPLARGRFGRRVKLLSEARGRSVAYRSIKRGVAKRLFRNSRSAASSHSDTIVTPSQSFNKSSRIVQSPLRSWSRRRWTLNRRRRRREIVLGADVPTPNFTDRFQFRTTASPTGLAHRNGTQFVHPNWPKAAKPANSSPPTASRLVSFGDAEAGH
jgi:hypothetical protein